MTLSVSVTPQFQLQLDLLGSDVGVPGSGAARYGAAMFFFVEGMLSAEMLEIYRCCSKFDAEDPVHVARYEGVELPALILEAQEEQKRK